MLRIQLFYIIIAYFEIKPTYIAKETIFQTTEIMIDNDIQIAKEKQPETIEQFYGDQDHVSLRSLQKFLANALELITY